MPPSPERLRRLVPKCDGSYGQTPCGDATAVPQDASPAWPSGCNMMGAPPVEDVLRWKEFRRRQKVESQAQQWQRGADERRAKEQATRFAQAREQLQQQQQSGGTGRRSLGETLDGAATAALPHWDSLCMSLSGSTGGGKSGTASGTATNPMRESAGPNSQGGLSAGPVEIIDRMGFPVPPPDAVWSPASLPSDELRKGRSQETDPNMAGEADPTNARAVPLRAFFSALEPTVDAVRQEHITSGSFDRLHSVKGVHGSVDAVDARSAAGTPEGSQGAPSEIPSEVPSEAAPTEIAGNTARRVAERSNWLARRMAGEQATPSLTASAAEDATAAEGAPPSTTTGAPAPPSAADAARTIDTTPAPTTRTGGPPSLSTSATTNGLPAATNGRSTPTMECSSVAAPSPSPAGMPRLLTPRAAAPSEPPPSCSLSSTASASERLRRAATPSGTPAGATPSSLASGGATPGWDPTRTTVRNEMLEGVLATPQEEGGGVDVPTSPSTAPMGEAVPNGEGGRDDGAEKEGAKPEGAEEGAAASNAGEPEGSVASGNPHDVSTVGSDWDPLHVSTIEEEDFDPSDEEGDADVPTLDEVHAFMRQLQQLQDETPSPEQPTEAKTIGGMDYLPAGDEGEVVVKDEHVEFNKSLLEKKAKLKAVKMESDRRKKEFDERMKAFRSRAYVGSEEDPPLTELPTTPADEEKKGQNDTDDDPPLLELPPTPADETKKKESAPSTPADKRDERPFPTDEKPPPPRPIAPGARWSGGLARWSHADAAPAKPPAPSPLQKLSVALDEDDFSFRPASVGGADAIPIPMSPLVAGAAAADPKFQCDAAAARSPPETVPEQAAASPAGTLLRTTGGAANSATAGRGTAAAQRRSRSEPPTGGRSALADVDKEERVASSEEVPSPGIAPEPSPRRPSSESAPAPQSSPPTSDHTSEGDRGAGLGFAPPPSLPRAGDMGDRTASPIGSATSSNVVEPGAPHGLGIGQRDPPAQDDGEEPKDPEESFLGVTVERRRKQRSPRGPADKNGLEPADEAGRGSLGNDAGRGEAPSHDEEVVRTPRDPDGVDWTELAAEAATRAENDRTLARLKQAQAARRRQPGGNGPVATLGIVPEHGGLRPVALKVSIATAGGDDDYSAVMGRAKACLTPRETSLDDMGINKSSDVLAPRSVQSDSWGRRGIPSSEGGRSSIREIRSMFEAGRASPPALTAAEARARFESKLGAGGSLASTGRDFRKPSFLPRAKTDPERGGRARKDFFGGPTMESEGEAPELVLPESTSKEHDDLALAASHSSDGVSLKDLRARFENGRGPLPHPSNTSAACAGATRIGSGIYLQHRELQAMSSLDSSTLATAESSLVKSEAHEGTIGDGTLGDGTLSTKRVLRYAQRLEKREARADSNAEGDDSMTSFDVIETKETGSSKENRASGAVAPAAGGDGEDSPAFSSPVKLRRMAFEAKQNPKVAAKKTPERKMTSLSPKRDVPAPQTTTGTAAVAPAATPAHEESPATSVKDRIAVFGGHAPRLARDPSNGAANAMPVPRASPVQAKSPPRTAAAHRAKPNAPSPLWIAHKRSGGRGGGPNKAAPSASANKSSPAVGGRGPSNNRTSPLKLPTSPPLKARRGDYQGGAKARRPSPVQTARYESPIARVHYDDDEEDGITLSPTFSEVSGLTIPTCLDGGDGASRASDVFDNLSKGGQMYHEAMSPIARHRKQQEKGKGGVATHPYLQRAGNADSTDRLHEMKTPRARGSPGVGGKKPRSRAQSPLQQGKNSNAASHREKIVSRVRASPRNKADPTNKLSRSRMNSISEHDQLGLSQSSSTGKSPVRHFDGRNAAKSTEPKNLQDRKDRYESVARVNRNAKKGQRRSNQYSKTSRPAGDGDPDSLATQDCIRVD